MLGRGDVTGYKGQCLVEGWGKAGLAVMVDHLDWIVDIPQKECVSKGQHGKKKRGGVSACVFIFLWLIQCFSFCMWLVLHCYVVFLTQRVSEM